jgi:hypothetical protein
MSPKKISRAVHDLDVVRSFLDVSTVVYGIVCVAGGAGKSGDFGEGFYVGQTPEQLDQQHARSARVHHLLQPLSRP